MASERSNVEWENSHEQEDMTIGGTNRYREHGQGLLRVLFFATINPQAATPEPSRSSISYPQLSIPHSAAMCDTNPGIAAEALNTLFEATQQIQAALQSQATIIIALTAHASSEERSGMLEVGCDKFVPRPFQENILLENIADCLSLQYVCDEQKQYTAPQLAENREVFSPEALAVMPRAWLAQLHRTAESCNDEEILTLIEQIPEHPMAVKLALTDLVDNLRFDLIFDLTQGSTND